jgi:L-aspartate oxidase
MRLPDYIDFIIIGSGIAGLGTAVNCSKYGQTLVITKSTLLESNTYFAQGGIAAAIAPGDSPEAHYKDTLVAGADLCESDAVSVLVQNGPKRVQDLIAMGTHFDTTPSGSFDFGREGAHSIARILHARGDATGAELASVLANKAKEIPNIIIAENCLVADLIIQDNRCIGCWVLNDEGQFQAVTAKGTVIAAGGCGQIYKHTTNPWVATGDGIAMAYRAGAEIVHMEFVQFHPTALKNHNNPLFLVSEAVRGDGGKLITEEGKRFMVGVHPMEELAPRDVVARAIYHQQKAGREVFLDATSIKNFSSRFPTIYKACTEVGINPLTDPIPITPAAHFIMGGILADTYGRTNIQSLYVCGESACVGVHGANRLASNSLLEGIVFSERIVECLKDESSLPAVPPLSSHLEKPVVSAPVLEDTVRETMWSYAGLIRTEKDLLKALSKLDEIKMSAPINAYTLHNMLDVAKLIVSGALYRKESRGGHYRLDYPDQDAHWKELMVEHSIGSQPKLVLRTKRDSVLSFNDL